MTAEIAETVEEAVTPPASEIVAPVEDADASASASAPAAPVSAAQLPPASAEVDPGPATTAHKASRTQPAEGAQRRRHRAAPKLVREPDNAHAVDGPAPQD